MTARARPWIVVYRDSRYGRAATRAAAQNLVDRGRGRIWGAVRIYNERTGEQWERRFGSWSKCDGPASEVAMAQAAAEGARHQNEVSAEAAPLPWWVEL